MADTTVDWVNGSGHKREWAEFDWFAGIYHGHSICGKIRVSLCKRRSAQCGASCNKSVALANVVAPGQTPNATTTATLSQANTTTVTQRIPTSTPEESSTKADSTESRAGSETRKGEIKIEPSRSQPATPPSEPSGPKESHIQYSEN